MLPAVEHLIARTAAGPRLTRLIEQSGTRITPGAVVVASLCGAVALPFLVGLVVRAPFVGPVSALIGMSVPLLVLHAASNSPSPQIRGAVSRSARSAVPGHARGTCVSDRARHRRRRAAITGGRRAQKVFDQQNFGLPLQDALNELAARVPILDVKFFVTAVAIQRESGGNLAEILDNLAHVVRERFKIQRQVRTHTAHGRFTGFVLLALPAALAVALSFISPEHIEMLVSEPMGRMMIAVAIVMQTVGFVWIRQVIKIEV